MSKREKIRRTVLGVMLLGLIISGSLIGYTIFKASTYEEITAEITEITKGIGGRRKYLIIDFKYTYNDVDYEKTSQIRKSGFSKVVGDEITVHVNPENPEKVVFYSTTRGLQGLIFFFVVYMVIFVVGLRTKAENMSITFNGVEVD